MSRISPEQAIAPRWVVYRLLSEHDEPLYVGMTGNLQSRLQQHSKQDYWRVTRAIEVEELPDRDSALQREGDLIDEFDPPFNTVGRRTKESRPVGGVSGTLETCLRCGAMVLPCNGGFVDPQLKYSDGTGVGNAELVHRCPRGVYAT